MQLPLSLYDALVSINVPSDKARSVVDALERDMGTVLATKTDLDSGLRLVRQDLDSGLRLMRQDLDSGLRLVRQDLDSGLLLVRQDFDNRFQLLKQEMGALGERLDQRIEALEKRFDEQLDSRLEVLRSSMTVRLGSMIFVSMGLLFAALRLT